MKLYTSIHSMPEFAHLARDERQQLWRRSLRNRPPAKLPGVLAAVVGYGVALFDPHYGIAVAVWIVIGAVVGHVILASRRSQLIKLHEQSTERSQRAALRRTAALQRS